MQALRQRVKTIVLLIVGILLSVMGRAQANPIAIPGTSVSLDPPAGFTVSDNFSGLESPESGSSITINELPSEAYEEVSTVFSTTESAAEALLRQGILVEEHTLLDVGETQVPVLRGVQQAAGGEVTKYLTLFKGETTVLVTFNILDPGRITQDVVETTIASITLAAAPTIEEKIAQLSFSFQPAAPFIISNVIGGSGVLLTTFEGTDPSGMEPIAIIARGQNIIYGQDATDISEDLLRGTRGFLLATVVRQEAVEFAGGNGYFIEAEIDELTIVQYVYVPANGRYIRLLATGESNKFTNVFPTVKEIASSVVVID